MNIIQGHLNLAFVYEADAALPAESQHKVSVAVMALLPPELIARFEEALDLLDVEMMYSIIDEMALDQPEIRAGLRELTYNFQFAQLQSLLEEAKSNAQSTAR